MIQKSVFKVFLIEKIIFFVIIHKWGEIMTGRIHSIETFGTVDGPGTRYVIFMQGCPMRCKYCHNPDTWEYAGGNEKKPSELVNDVLRYKSYYKTGGVTVSGGEPLLQIDFVTELFKQLKEKGIHTALDTSGVTFDRSNTSKIDLLLEFTDLVLLDIKHIDNKSHIKLTGKKNTNILEFAKYLDSVNKSVWIRHVIVPTININELDLSRTREFLDTLTNVEVISILPYHTLALPKYENLGMTYPLAGVSEPTKAEIKLAKRILKEGYKFAKTK